MIRVFAVGRVAQDAKVFEYGSGRKSSTGVSFGLICNKYYGDESPTYIQCTMFNRDEKVAQYITTGRQMTVMGDLSRNDDGYYSLIVNDFEYGQLPGSANGDNGNYGNNDRGGRNSSRNDRGDNNNRNGRNYNNNGSYGDNMSGYNGPDMGDSGMPY